MNSSERNAGNRFLDQNQATPRHNLPATQDDLAELPWKWWRNQMPIVDQWDYLDHAAVGPLSGRAADAIREFASQGELEGDTVWPEWNRRLADLRASFGGLIGAETKEICLVPNTTTGINLVAEGWPWQPGDNVIVPDGEFPSNLYPWQNQQSRGVELRVVSRRGDEVDLDDLFAEADDRTRMISVSWVGYASGYRIDLDELVARAHEKNILVFVDAIQGLGVFDLDCRKTPVDFLAADGHKWLLGPEGLGVAMIRHEHLDKIRCTNVGWNSVASAFNYAQPELKLRDAASRFESGSNNMIGAAALSASLSIFNDIIDSHGRHAIGNRVIELATKLNERLKKIGAITRLPSEDRHRSGIVTFTVPWAKPSEIRSATLLKNCVVSCRDGGVRAALHAYNDESDLDRLVEIVLERKTN